MLALALIQQNIYTGTSKYRPSNLTNTVVIRQTFSSFIQLTYVYTISSWVNVVQLTVV